MAEVNIEYETFREARNKLIIGFTFDMQALASSLNTEGLISDRCYDTVANPRICYDDSEKSSMMVSEIMNKISNKAENYHKVMKILASNQQYRDLIEILEEIYASKESTSSARGRVAINGGTKTQDNPKYTDEEEQSLREKNSPAMTPLSSTPKHAELIKFSEEVEIILHTVNDHEYNAATTYMEAPLGGQFTKAVIFPCKGSVVGMFAGKKTALIQTEQGNKARKDIENALKNFLKATYILGIGVCYSLNDSKHQFGDVLVSEWISDYNTPRFGTKFENRGETKEVHESLFRIFCKNLDEFNKKSLVSESPKGRYSKVYSGLLICSPQLIADEEIREKIKESVPTAIGGEMEGGELSTFIGKKEVSGIIIIKGVADFGDDRKKEGKKWQFTSAMAAFKYAHLKLSSIPELF